MKYIFLFGRNKDLALLELLSVLKKMGVKYDSLMLQSNDLMIETEVELDADMLADTLAGTTKIFEVKYVGETLESSVFDQIDFYYPKNFNIFFSTLNNISAGEIDELGQSFTKSNKLRGQITFTSDTFKPQSHVESDPEKNTELIIGKLDNGIFFVGKILKYLNSSMFRFLDEQRPGRRFTHGTSFRVTRMMVNILSPEKNSTVVDPFCGTGTFLIELMRAGCNVVGIDTNEKLISIARENIEWAKKEFGISTEYKLHCTSSEVANFDADHIIFEPYMGPFMKELPSEKEAKKVIQELHGLYHRIFKNIYENTSDSAHMVCIIPSFETKERQILKLSGDLFLQTGFRPVDFSAEYQGFNLKNPTPYDAADGSLIKREIWVLRKVAK